MAIKQTIWSLEDKKELQLSSLVNENELEELIADNIGLLSDEWLLVGRQVRTIYGGIIDLLCIDVGGNPIVVELKKNMTPRDVTAQVLDYASWVKEIDAGQLAEIYRKHFQNEKSLGDAFKECFGIELRDDNDDVDAKMVIVATDMDGSTERIIKYLQGYGIDINVLFFNVFEHQGKRLLSRAWMFEPGPNIISSSNKWNGEYYFSFGEGDHRSWEDAIKYGFVSAGGDPWFTRTMLKLEESNRIWVCMPQNGYVGVGIVMNKARPARETILLLDGQETNFFDLPLTADYRKDMSPEKEEYIVCVNWLKTVPKNNGIWEYGLFANQNTVAQPKANSWTLTIKRLKEIWGIED